MLSKALETPELDPNQQKTKPGDFLAPLSKSYIGGSFL